MTGRGWFETGYGETWWDMVIWDKGFRSITVNTRFETKTRKRRFDG
jgi:hypothetical protein